MLSRGEQLRRASRTGAAIAKIYLGYKGLNLVDRGLLHPLVRVVRRRWHAASARTLHAAAIDLGGLLLKAGQFVGTRADLLPDAYLEELTELHDRVPAHPYPVVVGVIESELGAAPEELFARFWRQPAASASLAQVHRATLHDGREVVVKVQRPEIRDSLSFDLRNLRLALGAIEWLEGPFGLKLLLDELEECLPRELDFIAEAENATRMAELFRNEPRVQIPTPVPELTTKRVLVSEYTPGIKISARRRLESAGLDPAAVARTLVEIYATQVFDYGFFHADPHPGNLFVTPAAESPTGFSLVFVDFGLAQEVPASFRRNLGQLFAALLGGDAEAAAAALAELGLETGAADHDTLKRTADLALEALRRRREQQGQKDYRDLGRDLTSALRSDPLVRLPSHLVLLARVVGLISGIVRSLGVHIDPARILLPHLASRS